MATASLHDQDHNLALTLRTFSQILANQLICIQKVQTYWKHWVWKYVLVSSTLLTHPFWAFSLFFISILVKPHGAVACKVRDLTHAWCEWCTLTVKNGPFTFIPTTRRKKKTLWISLHLAKSRLWWLTCHLHVVQNFTLFLESPVSYDHRIYQAEAHEFVWLSHWRLQWYPLQRRQTYCLVHGLK